MSKRKYSSYNKLRMRLTRAGIEKPCPTATFLLDAFVERDGIIFAEEVVQAGLCKEKFFKKWRQPLIDSNFLIYDHEFAQTNHRAKHSPGLELTRMVNEELLKTGVVVTEKKLAKELDIVNSRVDSVESFLKTLIEIVDPPFNDEKKTHYMSNAQAVVEAVEARLLEKMLEKKPSNNTYPDFSKHLDN